MVNQFEISKDTIQEVTESAAQHVGRIATILATAVRDVTREVGDWISDVIEMQEAAKRAQADREPPEAPAAQSADDEESDDSR